MIAGLPVSSGAHLKEYLMMVGRDPLDHRLTSCFCLFPSQIPLEGIGSSGFFIDRSTPALFPSAASK